MTQDEWQTRETLLARVKNVHDEASWAEFLAVYGPFVHRLARRMGLQHHDAEDLVQRVTLKLWQKLPDFRYDAERGKFRNWLCTVAVNELRQSRRGKRAVLEARETDGEQLQARLEKLSVAPDLEAVAKEEWMDYITQMAWQTVSTQFAEKTVAAFQMLSEGKAVDDVAADLAITTGTAYSYKKRVQDRLCAEIARLRADLE